MNSFSIANYYNFKNKNNKYKPFGILLPIGAQGSFVLTVVPCAFCCAAEKKAAVVHKVMYGGHHEVRFTAWEMIVVGQTI